MSRRAKYIILNVVFCSLFLVSCRESKVEKIQGVTLNKGAIIALNNGNYENYDLQEGKYSKIESEEIIRIYDEDSGNYVLQKEDQYQYFYDGIINNLNDIGSNVSNLKLSPKGRYVSYFSNNEGLGLHLINLDNNSPIEFESNVLISGTFLDWLDEENIVYYGISNDGVNGIFQYNVKDKVEKLFYKLEGGYIHFIKNVESGVVCIQETIDNKKIVRLLSKDGNEKEVLSGELNNAYDVVYDGSKYYFLGKSTNNITSIYKLENNKLKRMVYDFPKTINEKKGLSIDDEGNILFVGANSSDNKEQIYKIQNDGAVSVVESNSVDYDFVKYQ
ncbi:MAG: WD40 repeat domain-containing protein [Clostridiaceae bacterium]|nr:WD40 repeat domain-containing protein [Clostridiaceae bacterium]